MHRILSSEPRCNTSSDGSVLVCTVTISRTSVTICFTAPTVRDLAVDSPRAGRTTTRRAGVLEVQDAVQHARVVLTNNVMNMRLARL